MGEDCDVTIGADFFSLGGRESALRGACLSVEGAGLCDVGGVLCC